MKNIAYAGALSEAINEEMERDDTILMMGEDVGNPPTPFGITAGLIDRFGPKRVKNTPISESAIVGAAVGASATGLRPIVEIMFIDFVGTCMDQIFNQAAKMRYMFGGQVTLPMVIRTTCGAGFCAAGQHSQSLEAWFAHVPGLKVVMPSTPYDAKGLLKSSIRDNNPVVFIENKVLYASEGEIPEEDYVVPIGEAEIKREGKDVTVVTWSRMVQVALSAADRLKEEGIDVEVVDLRTIAPLDKETILNSVEKTGKCVVFHEACRTAGFGAEVAAIVADEAFDWLDGPIKRVTGPDTIVPFSPPMETWYVPDEENLIEVIKAME